LKEPNSTPCRQITKLAGRMILKARAERREMDPSIRQRRFSLKLNSTVLRDSPPYLTIVS